MNADRTVLSARNLALIKGNKEIIDIDRFSLYDGEVVALVGPNGAGKTSLLLTLALLQQPTRGELSYFGRPLKRKEILSLRRQMAVVFQEPLLMDTTVIGNLLTGLKIRGIAGKEALSRSEEWLERLGILPLAHQPALHLSGGEAQRVNLARAFALQPRLLFMDEPFSALDYPTRNQLLDDISIILKETGITTLLVTHDLSEIPALAGRVAVLLGGRIIQNGSVAEVLGAAAPPPRIMAPWEKKSICSLKAGSK